MLASPFNFLGRPWDGVLEALAEGERAARAWSRGGLGAARVDGLAFLRRSWASLPKEELLPGPPIVYLPALPWRFRFQRPQQLARALGARGQPVLYVSGFRRTWIQPRQRLRSVGSGVAVLRVRVAGRPDPFREPLADRAAEELAATLQAGLRRPAALVVAQHPFWEPLAVRLRARLGTPLVYDCIDLHRGFPGIPKEVEEAEARLLAAADLVTASSHGLACRCHELGARAITVRNGVAPEDFPLAEPPVDTTIGYVGALSSWFDAEAVATAAAALPGVPFRLAGRPEDERLRLLGALANVELVGEIPYRSVPAFVGGLSASIVPFLDLPLTRVVDPVKLYEALATGVPVVARRLPETERWPEPLVYCYEHPEELARQLTRALAEDTEELRRLRHLAMAEETWNTRAAQLLKAAASSVAR